MQKLAHSFAEDSVPTHFGFFSICSRILKGASSSESSHQNLAEADRRSVSREYMNRKYTISDTFQMTHIAYEDSANKQMNRMI